MSETFELAFSRSVDHEGGFQIEAADRGNWTGGAVGAGKLKGTKYGISAASYPGLAIEQLTVEDARAIYKRDWWDALELDRLRPATAYQLFDAAINHGTFHASRMLQYAAGAKPDGILGPQTRAAALAADLDDLLMRFLAERLAFMADLRTFSEYGRGWSRRIAHNLRFAADDSP